MSWLNSWKKRVKLTVDNTNIDDTLSEFPVLIKISDSSGISSTDITSVFTELGSDANRKKIAVTAFDGITQCYVEIERFDYSNSVAWLWVKIPSVFSGAETVLYFYYDSDQADNTTYVGDTGDAPAQSVWDSNFKLVMHMAQDPNGDVADAIKDSTSNVNHGTPAGTMTSTDLVDGKIGKAIDFDGNNDYINKGSLTFNSRNSFTIEIISKLTQADVVQRWVSFHNPANVLGPQIFIRATADNYAQVFGRGVNTDTAAIKTDVVDLDDSSNHYIAGTIDGNVGKVELFVEESSKGSTTTSQFTLNDLPTLNIGIGFSGGASPQAFGGVEDEFRISNTIRSAAWIKATYYSNWDELVSFGSEETEAVNYISGYVKESTTPINRQIYLHNRDTGALITSTTSSGVGGYFYMETTYSGAHYVVCLDDAIGVSYNDLIYGNIYPATTSG